jgi:hypothetical protein
MAFRTARRHWLSTSKRIYLDPPSSSPSVKCWWVDSCFSNTSRLQLVLFICLINVNYDACHGSGAATCR